MMVWHDMCRQNWVPEHRGISGHISANESVTYLSCLLELAYSSLFQVLINMYINNLPHLELPLSPWATADWTTCSPVTQPDHKPTTDYFKLCNLVKMIICVSWTHWNTWMKGNRTICQLVRELKSHGQRSLVGYKSMGSQRVRHDLVSKQRRELKQKGHEAYKGWNSNKVTSDGQCFGKIKVWTRYKKPNRNKHGLYPSAMYMEECMDLPGLWSGDWWSSSCQRYAG